MFVILLDGSPFPFQRLSTALTLRPSKLIGRREHTLLFMFLSSMCQGQLLMGRNDRSPYVNELKCNIIMRLVMFAWVLKE
jgi:hypothetical protein